jgi:hypothetical protein
VRFKVRSGRKACRHELCVKVWSGGVSKAKVKKVSCFIHFFDGCFLDGVPKWVVHVAGMIRIDVPFAVSASAEFATASVGSGRLEGTGRVGTGGGDVVRSGR